MSKITIVTPSYNQAQYLEATIQSVLSQDYPNVEYIIVDGSSTDGSVEIIRRYEDEISYWVSEADEGQAHALKKGFSRATGDILGWLNSDDVYVTPQVLARVAALFAGYPKVDVVSGTAVMIDSNGRWLRQTEFEPAYVSYRHLCYRNRLIQPATFFRADALATTGLDQSLHFTFDWDLWIRLAHTHNIMMVDEVWAGYRWWGENKTASGNPQRTREQAEVTGRYLGRLSWQYWTLRLFYRLYEIGEQMPAPVGARLKAAVHTFSRLLSLATRQRIAVV